METIAHILALALAIVVALIFWDCIHNPVEPTQPLPLGAGPGWRPETAWRPLGRDRTSMLVNSVGWYHNHNREPIGDDAYWCPPLPEIVWRDLHPVYGLRTL